MPLEPGVQFYDDFTGNGLGVGVPIGWTLVAGQTPEIIADTKAIGGKALQLLGSGVSTALGYTAAGSAISTCEVLVAIRTNAEKSSVSPYASMSGPGGRLNAVSTLAKGMGTLGTVRSARCVCDILCQRALSYPRGDPRHPERVLIAKNPELQELTGFAIGTSDGNSASAVSTILSGIPAVGYRGSSGTLGGPDNNYVLEGVDLADAKLKYPDYYTCLGNPACRDSLVDRYKVCATQNLYGDSVYRYTFMKLRIEAGQPNNVKGKWWKPGEDEPTSWMIDGIHNNAQLPASTGMMGILYRRQSNNDDLAILFDWVSMSLDPDNFPPVTPDGENSSECPLPDGVIGEEYEETLDFDDVSS